MRRRTLALSRLLVVLGVAHAVAPGCSCGDPPLTPEPPTSPEVCGSLLLSNTLPASPAVVDATDIASYRYDAPLDARALELTLRDDTGESLGVALVEQLADGTMRATLGDVTLLTRGRRLARGRHTVEAALLFSSAPTLHIEGTLEDRRCLPVEAPRELACAPGVSLRPNDGLIVPGCGLDFDKRLARGEVPTLTRLSYAVSSAGESDVLFPPPRAFDAIIEGEQAPEGQRIGWLGDAGVLDALQSQDARMLLAAYSDRAWSRLLAQHVAHCMTGGAFEDELVFVDPAPVTQPLEVGSNGERDTDAWGGGGGSADSGASSTGDPHLVTFDGHLYDFQAQGEFVLARSPGTDEVSPIEVQARFQPPADVRDHPLCASVSFTTGVAVRFGDQIFEVKNNGDVLLDGSPLAAGATPDLDGGRRAFEVTGGSYRLRWEDGTEVIIPARAGSVNMTTTPALAGTFSGLFGDADGDPDNDVLADDGTPLARPIPFDVLYGEVRTRWSVDDDTSLFTYAANQSHATFDDPSFPVGPVDTSLIPPAERVDLEQTCRQSGVTGPNLVDCVLDLFCTSDVGLADDGRGVPATDRDVPGSVALTGAVVEAGYGATFTPGTPADEDGCTAHRPGLALLYPELETELATDLDVDVQGAGALTAAPATIAADTRVRSYLLHIPPADGGAVIVGGLRFAGTILGVQQEDTTLLAGNVLLPAGVTVATGGAHGVIDASGFRIGDDLRTLTFEHTQLAESGESLRILVSAPAEVTP